MKIRIQVLVVLAVGAAAWAVPPVATRTLVSSEEDPVAAAETYIGGYYVQPPADETPEQQAALSQAIISGFPLPPGYTDFESLGQIKFSLTGESLPNRERNYVVNVTDKEADLGAAELYLNEALVASVAIGDGIARQAGAATATFSGVVDMATFVSAHVVWYDINNVVAGEGKLGW